MKRSMHIAVLVALLLCTFAGCRSGSTNNTTAATTSTTQAATTKPGMDDMLPGPEDTIDPSNGANEHDRTESTTATNASEVPDEAPSRIRPRPKYIP